MNWDHCLSEPLSKFSSKSGQGSLLSHYINSSCLVFFDWSSFTCMSIIVSITKSSIVIGPSCAFLSRNRCVITCVSHGNTRCPIWTFCNRIPVIGWPRDSYVNINESFAKFPKLKLFPAVFKPWGKLCRRFCAKEVPKRQLYSKIWLRYNQLAIGPRWVMVFVISNQPHASHSSDCGIC